MQQYQDLQNLALRSDGYFSDGRMIIGLQNLALRSDQFIDENRRQMILGLQNLRTPRYLTDANY